MKLFTAILILIAAYIAAQQIAVSEKTGRTASTRTILSENENYKIPVEGCEGEIYRHLPPRKSPG